MSGSRKLQDVLVDAKVPVRERNAVPVLACEGKPVWVPGYRVARDWCVRDPGAPALQVLIERTGTPDDA